MLAARAVAGENADAARDSEGAGVNDDQMLRVIGVINTRLRALEEENKKLLALRKTIEPTFSLVPGNVIGFDSLGLNSVEIDVGSEGGVETNSPVLVGIAKDISQFENMDFKVTLGSGALCGWIAYSPGPLTARVKLITSRDVALPAYIVHIDRDPDRVQIRTEVRVEGTGKGGLRATMIPRQHNVEKGDLVILSKPNAVHLPVSLAVGTVSEVKDSTQHPQMVDAVITPYFDEPNRIYVLISAAEEP
jgi:cell shape-determining protein MreC